MRCGGPAPFNLELLFSFQPRLTIGVNKHRFSLSVASPEPPPRQRKVRFSLYENAWKTFMVFFSETPA